MPSDKDFDALVDIVDGVLGWLGSLLTQASIYNKISAEALEQLEIRMGKLRAALDAKGGET